MISRIGAYLAFALCLTLVVPAVLMAQSADQTEETAQDSETVNTVYPDQDWSNLVSRANEAIANGRASDEALESIRDELDHWRGIFQKAQETNKDQIATYRAELASIGPEPAEGETEPDRITSLRAELQSQLDALEAPQLTADVAYGRANAMIGEIDKTLRERKAQELISRSATPLDPGNWLPALREIRRAVQRYGNELETLWQSPATRAELNQRLPVSLLSLAFGVFLLVRSRSFAERLTQRVQSRDPSARTQLLAFAVSLLQLVLPSLGILALSIAAYMLFVGGSLSETLMIGVFVAVIAMIAVRWLATKVFPKSEVAAEATTLVQDGRSQARIYLTSLGIILGLGLLIEGLSDAASISDQTRALLRFPLIVAASIAFWFLARLFVTQWHVVSDDEEEKTASGTSFLQRMLWFLGQALRIVAIAGPLAAVLGYSNLAAEIVYSSIASLALFAALAVFHILVRDLYAFATGRERGQAGDALFPVLATFLLSLACLPLFAVFWGARWTDILQVWSVLQAGVPVGETRIGLGAFFTLAIVFAIGFGLTRLLQATLKSTVLPRTGLDTGGQNAISAGIGYVGVAVAALVAITVAGVDLSGFALIASALSVGIGFGLQTIVSNFVSGLILLAERPISEGDWIEVGDQMGIVKDISVRSTRIETFDRTDVIVPNSDLISGTVTNWTRGNTVGRVTLNIGVAYGTDSRRVEAILQEICESHPLVSMSPPPRVFFTGFGADSLDFVAHCILRDVSFRMRVHSDLNHTINERFMAEGIEIPFAQRDIWLRNPEALTGAVAEKPIATTTDAPAKAPQPMPPGLDPEGEDGDGGGDAGR